MRRPPGCAERFALRRAVYAEFFSASGRRAVRRSQLSAFVLRVSPGSLPADVRRHRAAACAPFGGDHRGDTGLAFLMNYSGATATLGLAFAATGVLFPFFSPLLGWLGVFLTGSDTSANALFGTSRWLPRTLGLNPALMAASNSSGGVMGKMISLQSIAVAPRPPGMVHTRGSAACSASRCATAFSWRP